MLNNRFSWVLSAAYLLCGLILFMLARKVAPVFSYLHAPLLLPTRVFLLLGPWGWLAFMLSVAALLLVRQIKFRPRWLNPAVIAALWVALTGAVTGVACLAGVISFQPICVFSSKITVP
jgi:hypothetical protein